MRLSENWKNLPVLTTACLLMTAAPALGEVSIDGLSSELLSNVELLMRLDDEECTAPRRRIDAEFDSAHEEIRTALEAFGYYVPQVQSQLEQTEDCWLATFVVDPGNRVMLRDVRIEVAGEGVSDTAFTSLLSATPLRSEQPLVHAQYDALKQALRSLGVERGYREARFIESTIDVYPDELAADLSIAFDTGARFRFGEIVLEQDELSDELLSGYIDTREGQPYDSRRLAEARLELINSGYFDTVTIEPGVPDVQSRVIPVRIRLTPASRAQISYGVGFSTDTGPRFRFGRSIRRLNEDGHQINVNGLFSPVVIEASANYRLPYGDPRSEWISFDVGGIREDTETSNSRSLQMGARRVVTRSAAWTRTDLVSLQVEDFEVGSQSGRARLLMPGVEWVRLDADDAIRPRRGSRLDVQIRAANDSLGSDTSVVQLTVGGKWIWSLPHTMRLLIRGEVGRLWYDQFSDLPPSMRFFAGGDDSVRGYEFETLGPTNALGEVTGGSRLVTSGIELEKQIKPAWSLAVFADAGNAYRGSDLDLFSSVGIGARWQSPLGPVRIDVAKPQDGEDRGVRLHITLGPDL